jgi:hypothetical protein
MAYIGKEPIVGNFQKCDAITVVNGQAAYTLQVSSTNVVPESANHMLVSLNGILQAPVTSFTVSGSTLTFASNLATGDVIDFVILLGNVLDLGVPSDDTVGAAQIKDDLISGTTALASEPADTDEFLVSDAGTLKRIDYSLIKGGGITEADQWRFTTDFDSGTTTPKFITANWERNDTQFDKIGTGMSESSGVFTFPSTGIWKVDFVCSVYHASNDARVDVIIYYTANNSSYAEAALSYNGIRGQLNGAKERTTIVSAILDIDDTSNDKVKFGLEDLDNAVTVEGSSTYNFNSATFIRLGDT